MGWKCCVPHCKSGYKEGKEAPPPTSKLSFYRFPPEPDLRHTWIRNISRSDQEPNKNSRVCSIHFKATDFQAERTDKRFKSKKNSGVTRPAELQKRLLLQDAVPSNFPNLPKYFNKIVPNRYGKNKKILFIKVYPQSFSNDNTRYIL